MGEGTVSPIHLLLEGILLAFLEEFGLEIGMTFAKIMAGRKVRGKCDGIFFRKIQCIAELGNHRLQAAYGEEFSCYTTDLQEMREEQDIRIGLCPQGSHRYR